MSSSTLRHMSDKRHPLDLNGDGSVDKVEILSTFVRLGILIWSGAILTLNYVPISGLSQKTIDPTFIASVFTGTLATFGVQTSKKDKGSGNTELPHKVEVTMKPEQKASSQTSLKE